MPTPKRGRPSSGNALTKAERKAKEREGLRAAGVRVITVKLEPLAVEALTKLMDQHGLTQAEAVSLALVSSSP